MSFCPSVPRSLVSIAIAKRFAGAGGHYDQRVVAADDVMHHGQLVLAEGGEPEVRSQSGQATSVGEEEGSHFILFLTLLFLRSGKREH